MNPACLASITVPQRGIVPAVSNAHSNRALAASEVGLDKASLQRPGIVKY